MLSKRTFVLCLLPTVLAISTTTESAASIALSLANGTAGNQDFTGSLGMDFDVNSAIQITQLGAFDDLSDGIINPISVAIFDRNTQLQVGSPVTITSADTLSGGHRFETLAAPLNLEAGFQGSIVAWGYGNGDLNGNIANVPYGSVAFASTIDDGGGLISFVGSSRYSFAAASFPDIVDGNPVNRYYAGSFVFENQATSAVPEVSSYATWLFGLSSLVFWRYRRKHAAI